MKVRTKFTIWIALFSFLSAIFFSAFIFIELLEEPQKLIKRELLDIGNAILQHQRANKELDFGPTETDFPLERYWIKLSRENGDVIYSSPLTAIVDIPLKLDLQFYTVTQKLSPQNVWIDPQDHDDLDELGGDYVKFNVVVLSAPLDGGKITVIIGKPLAMLTSEIWELIHKSLVGLILSSVLIFFLSYFLAGRILQPLGQINQKIKEIHENSLGDRIPNGKSRDEIYTLTESLNAMFDRLHISFKQQKEFVSGASHEMRSPLAILMLGHEELLNNNLPETIRVELSKQLTTMQRLNKLIKDLLDLSQLEQQDTIERTEIELSSFIEKVVSDFNEMFLFYQIECTVNVYPLKIWADYDSLFRVFVNLVDNAIKFNLKKNGKIIITAQKKKGFVEIAIVNTGKEIPIDDLSNVFIQFYRVEKSRSQKFGGTGLGLTIVKTIVDLHGGTISLESIRNRTTVRVGLPII